MIAKALLDFLPVFAFAISFEVSHNFFMATFVLVFITIALTFYTFLKQKRIPYLALIICLETSLFGFLTIHNRSPGFIQLRDTLYDLSMGIAILGSAIVFKRPIIKKFFEHIFTLGDRDWMNLSYVWGILLLTFSVCNEYIRHNFPPYIWVKYKFAVIFITIIFGITLTFIYRKKIDKMPGF
jgi:intracellular septation protein A